MFLHISQVDCKMIFMVCVISQTTSSKCHVITVLNFYSFFREKAVDIQKKDEVLE